ncbi:MAG: hypothetical protein AAGA57_06835 [Planctomycetota bacterium]
MSPAPASAAPPGVSQAARERALRKLTAYAAALGLDPPADRRLAEQLLGAALDRFDPASEALSDADLAQRLAHAGLDTLRERLEAATNAEDPTQRQADLLRFAQMLRLPGDAPAPGAEAGRVSPDEALIPDAPGRDMPAQQIEALGLASMLWDLTRLGDLGQAVRRRCRTVLP